MNTLQTTRASILILALSACAGIAAAAEPNTAPSLADQLDYRGCSEQTALLIVPAILMPPLAPGFVYTTPAGDSLLAAIHVSTSSCESVDGGGPEQEMLAFALVKPPAELTIPEIGTYAVALGGYTNGQQTLATFESWGITDLIQPGSVDIKLAQLPLAHIGKVIAKSASSRVAMHITAVGLPTDFGGGRTRAYYMPNGVLVASFDAIYTAQQGMNAVGTVIQTGDGFLPLGISAAVGSHAWGYDLTVGEVQYY
ncbi:MAG: hypothetical protein JWQ90_2896 [Hydrocarboniphaga sp.]|uniref:hypothetical protein n=1 Tax=Hydrocarboniphaga sp. TaxID=2033016 RepID=UPI00260A523F|nr:hypothetical protein [Hydrocarboniphaga sp.]MDB5970446.1 hypothetical protein [Hydrocarboniphaga sp.]